MNKKLISGLLTAAIATTSVLPAFAADQQSSNVPVVGKIGVWNGNPTNPEDPNNGGGGGGTDPADPTNPPVNPPTNLTDISVTIPTVMTFNIVTNTTDKMPVLASANYKITNNGAQPLSLNISSDMGDSTVIFKDTPNDVTVKKDGKIELCLGMLVGPEDGSNENHFTVKKGEMVSAYSIDASKTYDLMFEKPNNQARAFEDVRIEQLKDTKTTVGNFTLKFSK